MDCNHEQHCLCVCGHPLRNHDDGHKCGGDHWYEGYKEVGYKHLEVDCSCEEFRPGVLCDCGQPELWERMKSGSF